MTLRQKVARFKRLLRRDPQARCPRLELAGVTPARVADHKHTTRAWDMARIELRLATPEEVTRENSAIHFPQDFNSRIVRYSSHAPAIRSRRF